MKGDLNILVEGIRLNIRVGIIFRYQNKTLIEIRKDRVGNSVIPGGRLRIDESRIGGLKREIMEEMNYELSSSRIKYIDTIESFFTFENQRVHEIFFVYKYKMNKKIYEDLLKIKENLDNHITDYIFVTDDEFSKVNLLPMELREMAK